MIELDEAGRSNRLDAPLSMVEEAIVLGTAYPNDKSAFTNAEVLQIIDDVRAERRASTIGGEPVRSAALEEAAAIHDREFVLVEQLLRSQEVAPGDATYAALVQIGGVHKIAAHRIRELKAHPAPSTREGVKVKALEWEEVSSRIFDAKGVCGLYRVNRYDDHWAAHLFGSAFNAERSTADEAKAAAQADYEARIRSALE
jgi:hypothetical protein